MDSGPSILKASLATLLLSIAHSAAQTILEFKLLDKVRGDECVLPELGTSTVQHAYLIDNQLQNLFDDSGLFDLHSHGGLALWVVTSALFALVRSFLLIRQVGVGALVLCLCVLLSSPFSSST